MASGVVQTAVGDTSFRGRMNNITLTDCRFRSYAFDRHHNPEYCCAQSLSVVNGVLTKAYGPFIWPSEISKVVCRNFLNGLPADRSRGRVLLLRNLTSDRCQSSAVSRDLVILELIPIDSRTSPSLSEALLPRTAFSAIVR